MLPNGINNWRINMKKRVDNIISLGKIIRQARKYQKLTQDDLSGLTGLGLRFISEVENGKETAQIGKVLLILSTLGIRLDAEAEWMDD